MESMRITALVPTHHLPEESMAWISEARNVFDEVIVLIDQKNAAPGTVARAEKVATEVALNDNDLWNDPDRFSLLARCNADWVFMLEYDEQLSPEWQQNEWRQILETTHFTHFWIPRRWIVPGNKYLHADPWWPDFQLRLFRNDVGGVAFPSKLHDTIYVPGPGACLKSLCIHHHVLWLSSRKMREDKVRYYEQLRPGGALSHYYLYEDYAAPLAPLPAPVTLDVSQEVVRMEALFPEEISMISLEVTGVPPEADSSAMFWLQARVTNDLDRGLYAVTPHPVRLAYHWLERSTRAMVVFEGVRSGLFPGLDAKAAAQYAMTILAPDQPGEYILQTTMVQEGVCWFENVRPDIIQEFGVSIRAGTPRKS
jgi:hypothetical protein